MKTTIEKFRLSKDRTFLQSVQLNICRGYIHLGALACVSIHRSVKSLRLIRPSLQFRAIFREQLNIFQAFVICDEISQTPVYLLQIICISRHFRKEPWASVKSRGIRQCAKDLCQSSFKKWQMVCVQAFVNGIIEKGKYWQRLLVQVNVATSRSEKAAAVTAWLGPPACQ